MSFKYQVEADKIKHWSKEIKYKLALLNNSVIFYAKNERMMK